MYIPNLLNEAKLLATLRETKTAVVEIADVNRIF